MESRITKAGATIEPQLSGTRRAVEHLLDDVCANKGAIGALVVSRDGFCIANRCARLLRPETFAAMTAALYSATETAFVELGSSGTAYVATESDRLMFVTLGLTDEMLVVAVASRGEDLPSFLKATTSAAARFRSHKEA